MKHKLLPLLALCILGQDITAKTINVDGLSEEAFAKVKTCPKLIENESDCLKKWIEPIDKDKRAYIVYNGVTFLGAQSIEDGGYRGYVLTCNRNGKVFQKMFVYDYEKNQLHAYNIDNITQNFPIVEGEVYHDTSGFDFNQEGIIVEDVLNDQFIDTDTRKYYQDAERFFHILKSYALQLNLLVDGTLENAMNDDNIEQTMAIVCAEVNARKDVYESIISIKKSAQSELSRHNIKDKLNKLQTEIDSLLGTSNGTEPSVKGKIDQLKNTLETLLSEATLGDIIEGKLVQCCEKMDSLTSLMGDKINDAKSEILVPTNKLIREFIPGSDEDEETKNKTLRELVLKGFIANPQLDPEIVEKVNNRLIKLGDNLEQKTISFSVFVKQILTNEKGEFVTITNATHAMDIIKTIIEKSKCNFMDPSYEVLKAISMVNNHVSLKEDELGKKQIYLQFETMYQDFIRKALLEYSQNTYVGLGDYYKFMIPIWLSEHNNFNARVLHRSYSDYLKYLYSNSDLNQVEYHFTRNQVPEPYYDFAHYIIKWNNHLFDSGANNNFAISPVLTGANGIFSMFSAIVESCKQKNNGSYPDLTNILYDIFEQRSKSANMTIIQYIEHFSDIIRSEIAQIAIAYSDDVLSFFKSIKNHAELSVIFKDVDSVNGDMQAYIDSFSENVYKNALNLRVWHDNAEFAEKFSDDDFEILANIFKYGYTDTNNGITVYKADNTTEKLDKIQHMFGSTLLMYKAMNTYQLTDFIVSIMRNKESLESNIYNPNRNLLNTLILIDEVCGQYDYLIGQSRDNNSIYDIAYSMKKFAREFCCFINKHIEKANVNDSASLQIIDQLVIGIKKSMEAVAMPGDFSSDELAILSALEVEIQCIMKNCLGKIIDNHKDKLDKMQHLSKLASHLFFYYEQPKVGLEYYEQPKVGLE